jgi:3-dehydro-L-gulonate 2-dehydrogenase
MLRIRFDELQQTLATVLRSLDFSSDRAALCARLFAETTRDGVYTHGVGRFPRFVRMVRAGRIEPHAVPTLVHAHGSLERWNGNLGAGNGNAYDCMNRAISLARGNGIGAVALANTTHWMRGGTYGWQAADANCIGICWTNTLPNLPPWGSAEPRIGNNPIVFAVPRARGHVVLDMAMSQFSYGALTAHRKRGEPLPVDGGFDSTGRLTRDAAAIEASQRPLPIGYWKGSGLSILLDLIAAILSGGLATHQILADPEQETGISQMFIAIDAGSAAADIADRVVKSLGPDVRYPGRRTLELRSENLTLGVPVDEAVWSEITAAVR